MLQNIVKDLEAVPEPTEEQLRLLGNHRLSIIEIEKYAAQKRAETEKWSKDELFKRFGPNLSVTLQFYPGTESYQSFGDSVTVSIRLSEEDIIGIVERSQAKQIGESGPIEARIIESMTDPEDYERIIVELSDVFIVTGRLIR